jgi:hypothetical protein
MTLAALRLDARHPLERRAARALAATRLLDQKKEPMQKRHSRIFMRVVLAGLLASCALVALRSEIVSAYVLEGQGWCNGSAGFSLQTTGSWPYVLDHSTPLNAASAWSGVTSKFRFNNLPDNTTTDVYGFSSNSGRSGRLAVTSYTYYPGINCMIAANVTYNTYYGFYPGTSYCDTLNPHDSYYDLYWVSLHELGHALGLDHSNDSTAVMYATVDGCSFRSLSTDDRNGIIAIYGP